MDKYHLKYQIHTILNYLNLQSQNNYNDHQHSTHSTTSPHTKYVCSIAYSVYVAVDIVALSYTVWKHSIVLVHLERSTVGCPNGSQYRKHPHLVHMFLSYSNISLCYLSDWNKHNTPNRWRSLLKVDISVRIRWHCSWQELLVWLTLSNIINGYNGNN